MYRRTSGGARRQPPPLQQRPYRGISHILMAALEATLLADEDSISYRRLIDAVDAWCMADGTIDRNFLKLHANEVQ